MKIATLNIDWCKKFKSEKVEMFLSQQDFDFLILTEAVNLNLSQFPFKYFSEQIPENTVYEGLNYSKYLSGEKAYRTIIYSKVPSARIFSVIDNKTSLALEFKTELENCLNDCNRISKINPNILIIGDLNTSFLENEKHYCINSETTKVLKSLFEKLNLINSTEKIKKTVRCVRF